MILNFYHRAYKLHELLFRIIKFIYISNTNSQTLWIFHWFILYSLFLKRCVYEFIRIVLIHVTTLPYPYLFSVRHASMIQASIPRQLWVRLIKNKSERLKINNLFWTHYRSNIRYLLGELMSWRHLPNCRFYPIFGRARLFLNFTKILNNFSDVSLA